MLSFLKLVSNGYTIYCSDDTITDEKLFRFVKNGNTVEHRVSRNELISGRIHENLLQFEDTLCKKVMQEMDKLNTAAIANIIYETQNVICSNNPSNNDDYATRARYNFCNALQKQQEILCDLINEKGKI